MFFFFFGCEVLSGFVGLVTGLRKDFRFLVNLDEEKKIITVGNRVGFYIRGGNI
jgi:hypothetical protein